MTSKRFELKKEDVQKVAKNALIFFAPVGVIYLTAVALEVEKDGFAWEDMRPNMVVIGSIMLYVVNVLLDFFRKWTAQTKY